MSRREIKACDTIDNQTGVCNREATGTCPLCEKDFCAVHVSQSYATIRIGLAPGGSPISHNAGWLDVQPCRACLESLQRIFAGSPWAQLQSILPSESAFVVALRALLAGETMKGKAGGTG